MMRTSNPALRGDIFSSVPAGIGVMTAQGTINKTLILLIITFITAAWTWSNPMNAQVLILPAAIIGLIVAFVTIFKKELAPITAPIYGAVEGVVLGAISVLFNAQYPGIAIQAVMLTFGVLFCMLGAYKTGLIKVTEKFKLGVVAATGGIAIFYFITIIIGFFGVKMPLVYSNSPAGIIFSLVVVGVAALNLVLDFDFIERGQEAGAPKYMEWYGAFSLMVTLIWLYLEILRLLGKVRSR